MNNHHFYFPQNKHELQACFDAFKVLRPHIDETIFIEQVTRQQQQGYRIIAIKVDNTVVSAAGFRFGEHLAWGKILYIDDLTTLPKHRGNRYAERLLDWLINHAKEKNCNELHLDTGYQRHSAHRLYLKKGLELKSHHLSMELK